MEEVLLEKYHSHTEKCASCRGALGNLQRLRLGLAVGTGLVWVLLPLLVLLHPGVSIVTVIILTVAVFMSGVVWLLLGKLERQFYQGREIPPRNWPEKVDKEAKPR
ncbi:hypothetical protein [Moorena sp. SIO3H5]|uniref:hypothetical protein n=1 Tax=Moorena sp. SIO3H5 TaxID=2607834 RepID=UPI0013B5C94C|nr:hypothetical protein [Moorena sp. SIO3H5]NEO67969.1 hypothetical protein [Moorena sp. SIO3H5]